MSANPLDVFKGATKGKTAGGLIPAVPAKQASRVSTPMKHDSANDSKTGDAKSGTCDDPTVGNVQFLSELFDGMRHDESIWVADFIASPKDKINSRWGGRALTPAQCLDDFPTHNAYFGVATVKRGINGTVNRDTAHFSRQFVVVLDDLAQSALKPTYKLETSSGNYQLGFKLSAPIEDVHIANRLAQEVARSGLGNDKQGNNPIRYVRLPAAINNRYGPDFRCKLEHFDPSHMVSLEELIEGLRLDYEFIMNGKSTRPTLPKAMVDEDGVITASDCEVVTDEQYSDLRSALCALDPDNRDEWVSTGIALKTLGDRGRMLWLEYSQRSAKWQPEDDHQWETFKADRTSWQSIFKKAQAIGWVNPRSNIANPTKKASSGPQIIVNKDGKPFDMAAFSLKGKSQEMKKKMLDDKYILGKLALYGQSTAIYAAPNSGKTLLTIYLLIESIKAGNINPEDVFYVNADDNYSGLVYKLGIAEEYGFHMIAPTYNDFDANKLPIYLNTLIADGTATGKVLILDTLKKFTELMDKKIGTEFGKVIRSFVMHGGTVIMLAHTNKHKDSEGKSVFSGTSDITDDCDCYYILEVIDKNGITKTVRFENQKDRGKVDKYASFVYSDMGSDNYRAKLESIKELTDGQVKEIEEIAEGNKAVEVDLLVIREIERAIESGIHVKTELVEKVYGADVGSREKIRRVLSAHSGDDYKKGHRWSVKSGDKHSYEYSLLPKQFTPAWNEYEMSANERANLDDYVDLSVGSDSSDLI